MVQQITEGVSIEVESFYLHEQSNPINNEFYFAYRITIANLTKDPVQLHSRYWNIVDSNGSHRVVEGEGVVGQQPVLQSGARYQYTSACNLRTDIGKMYGYYNFENLFNKRQFQVAIPEFILMAPYKLN
jgi:ApaG protein